MVQIYHGDTADTYYGYYRLLCNKVHTSYYYPVVMLLYRDSVIHSLPRLPYPGYGYTPTTLPYQHPQYGYTPTQYQTPSPVEYHDPHGGQLHPYEAKPGYEKVRTRIIW